MIGSYKQHVRNQKNVTLVVLITFVDGTPEVEFKVVPSKQADKVLGMIKEFPNPGEGEQFLADNKAKLDALKIEIINGALDCVVNRCCAMQAPTGGHKMTEAYKRHDISWSANLI